jgi:hypothetical protein
LERDLINSLDFELAKVDEFFVAREREVLTKVSAVREQLQQLEYHRKLFQVCAFLFMRFGHPMNARPQEYSSRQSRLTKVATITGVTKFAKFLHPRGKGYEQEETNWSPRAPAPSPNNFSTNIDEADSRSAILSLQLNPEQYQHARKELKKAVLELYR